MLHTEVRFPNAAETVLLHLINLLYLHMQACPYAEVTHKTAASFVRFIALDRFTVATGVK